MALALLSLLAVASDAHALPKAPASSTASILMLEGGHFPNSKRTVFTGSTVAGKVNSVSSRPPDLEVPLAMEKRVKLVPVSSLTMIKPPGGSGCV